MAGVDAYMLVWLCDVALHILYFVECSNGHDSSFKDWIKKNPATQNRLSEPRHYLE